MLQKIFNYLHKKDNRTTVAYITVFSTFILSLISVKIDETMGADGLPIIYFLQVIVFICWGVLFFVFLFGGYSKISQKFKDKAEKDYDELEFAKYIPEDELDELDEEIEEEEE